MSDIQVKCVDQTLTITNAPLIASGGVLEDRIIFDFCPLWDGYTKKAVFYRDKDNIYPVELADDTCYIPNDVLREKGKIYFGVYGTAASDNSETAYVRTSEVLSYEIAQGIFAATNVPDPTPNIYEQLFEKLGNLDSVLTKIETARQAAETAQAAAESALETVAQIEQNAEAAQQAAQNAQNAATNAVNTHNEDETAHSYIQDEINTHTENTTVHITADERTSWNSKSDKSVKVNTTLYATSWTSAKKYTLSNENITATCAVELLPRESGGITQEQYEALTGAMIVGGTQVAGSIQLVALGDAPTSDIPVTLIIRRDL